MGIHASNSHAGGMFIFISTNISNSFQSPMGIFQPQPNNINHKQLFNHSYFSSNISHQFTTINIVHGLWTRGVYIYSYINIFQFHFNIMSIPFNAHIIFTTYIWLIHRTYNLYNAYTWGVQRLYNSYIDYIIYTSSFSISFII